MALQATTAGQGNVREIMLNILTHTHKDYCNDFKHTHTHTNTHTQQTGKHKCTETQEPAHVGGGTHPTSFFVIFPF